MSAAEQPTNPILDAARDYAARGWRCIPIKAGEKRPTFNDWTRVATVDPDRIANWWGHGDRYGVGIVTGQESGIWVLDVDIADGKAGDDTLNTLQLEHGPLPQTVTAITGSGGQHRYFRWPDDAHIGTNGGRLGPGLDVRGDGGQVVAPPTIHPNGQRYIWLTGHAPGQVPVADAPPWLLELLRPVEAPTVPTLAPVATHDEHDDSPAAWFNQRITWAQLLTRDGWTLTRTLGSGEQQWTRPGKDGRDGISATVGHAGRDVLKVFTSSVAQLDADRAYSRFGYQAAMHHHGDRSELARQIRTGHTTINGETMPRHHDDLSWAQAADFTPLPPTGPEVDPTTGEVAETTPIDHGWTPADMGDILAADYHPAVPQLLTRVDGQALLYAGYINALWGESGSGKTWLAEVAVAQILTAGGTALYIDHEDTPAGAATRLRALGVPDTDIERGFIHIAPEQRWNDLAATMLHHLIEQTGIQLAVIDSTGEAMASDGVKPNDDDDVARWHQALPKFLTRRDVTVLLIDHIPKATDGPKLHAIGSQRKRAAITGAAYMVEAAVSPARGVTGHLKVICAKDRHGAHQRGQLVADATVTSNPAGDHVRIELTPHENTSRPTVLMGRVSKYLEQLGGQMASKNQIEREVEGKAAGIRMALSVLVDEGHVEMEMRTGRSGGSFFRHIKPFHDTDDLSWADTSPVDNSVDEVVDDEAASDLTSSPPETATSSHLVPTSSQPRPNLVPPPGDDLVPSSPPYNRGTTSRTPNPDDPESVDNSDDPYAELF